jgi:hypothetical protein
MPSPNHQFLFDVNFNVGNESVFNQESVNEGTPFPPVEGYFLLLDGTNFLLLDGENLTLL